jgi:hypothetical protein
VGDLPQQAGTDLAGLEAAVGGAEELEAVAVGHEHRLRLTEKAEDLHAQARGPLHHQHLLPADLHRVGVDGQTRDPPQPAALCRQLGPAGQECGRARVVGRKRDRRHDRLAGARQQQPSDERRRAPHR